MRQPRPYYVHAREATDAGEASGPTRSQTGIIWLRSAPVAESVDATDLKSVARKGVPVRVWPGAPAVQKNKPPETADWTPRKQWGGVAEAVRHDP
jgi:hypothetical protein